MLVFMTVFMVLFASKQSFWVDELDWMIGIITGKSVFNNQLFTGMFQRLLEQGYNLPLYYIIEKPFYELLPYGEIFLLIPSIVFVIFGIIILKKAGALIGGKNLGFIAVCVAFSSTTLIIQGGWEIRPYSITFCFSALTLLMYAKRLKAETTKNIILYGISLILLLFSHWFGSILALFYAFTDLWLYIRKKIALKCILSYILAGVFIIPWFLLMLLYHVVDLSNYWAKPPSIIAPIQTIAYLLSNTAAYCLCFGIGFIIILFGKNKKTNKETSKNANIWLIMNISIIWVIAPVLFYSRFINPSGGLYVSKYFFVLMPHIFLITGHGFLAALSAVERRFFTAEYQKKYLYGMAVLLFGISCFQSYQKAYSNITSIWEPYREVANHLSKDRRIYADNSLVICNGGSAWIEYYFNKQGLKIPANVALYHKPRHYQSQEILLFIENGGYTQPAPLSEIQLLSYNRIYLFEVHELFEKEFVSTIDRNWMLAESMPEFNRSIPDEKFLKRTVKNMFHIRSEAPQQPFGLRIYAKDP